MKALAVQRAKQNPNDVVIELKYHAVWNVVHRQSIFAADAEYVESVKAELADAHIPSVTFSALLWLAPDHIHVESPYATSWLRHVHNTPVHERCGHASSQG